METKKETSRILSKLRGPVLLNCEPRRREKQGLVITRASITDSAVVLHHEASAAARDQSQNLLSPFDNQGHGCKTIGHLEFVCLVLTPLFCPLRAWRDLVGSSTTGPSIRVGCRRERLRQSFRRRSRVPPGCPEQVSAMRSFLGGSWLLEETWGRRTTDSLLPSGESRPAYTLGSPGRKTVASPYICRRVQNQCFTATLFACACRHGCVGCIVGMSSQGWRGGPAGCWSPSTRNETGEGPSDQTPAAWFRCPIAGNPLDGGRTAGAVVISQPTN